MPDEDADPPSSIDTLLNGRLRLHQPRGGHRAGSDAVLLAAAAPDGFAGGAVDLGAGVGTAGLILAMRCPSARVRLVEIDPAVADYARRNVAENERSMRVDVLEADLFDKAAMSPLDASADLVLTNPPFLDAARARPPRDPGRRKAYMMPEPGLPAWIAAAAACLKSGGTLIVIHRADAVPELLAACRAQFGGLTLMPLLPDAATPAKRILLRARKGIKTPFALAPPLVLHADGRFTPPVAAIHRGDACLAWPT